MEASKSFTREEAKAIGEQLGADWNKFEVEQFRYGMDVELEHGSRDSKTNVTSDDPLITGKIVQAHLNEFPDYYHRLRHLEEQAEAHWQDGKETYCAVRKEDGDGFIITVYPAESNVLGGGWDFHFDKDGKFSEVIHLQ